MPANRLVLLLLRGTLLPLLVASAGVGLFEHRALRGSIERDRAVYVDAVGINCSAPLMFSSPLDAKDKLALLGESPDVLAAALLDDEGDRFASYTRDGAVALDATLVREGRTPAGTLVRPVLLGNEQIGTLAVAFDDGLARNWVLARAATMVLCLGLALVSLAHLRT